MNVQRVRSGIADIGRHRLSDNVDGILMQQIAIGLQLRGVEGDLIHVVLMIGEGAREIDVAAGDHAEGAEEGPIFVFRSNRDVLVLATATSGSR